VVSASGVRADWYHASDDENDANFGFDPVWEAKANIDALGWTAEMRIPFSQLRFTNQPVQVWGFNANRWNPVTSEDDYWIPVAHRPHRMVVVSWDSSWASRASSPRAGSK